MANISLTCHPATAAFKAESIDVSLKWTTDQRLLLRYQLRCDFAELELGEPFEDPVQVDGLWQSTCFELFLHDPASTQYMEFNFAPLGNWAAYRFDDYRKGMGHLPMEPLEMELNGDNDGIILDVSLPLRGLVNGPMYAGLSAVIHEQGDTKSYWALAHPPGPPDFHHKDCFALKLAPPEHP